MDEVTPTKGKSRWEIAGASSLQAIAAIAAIALSVIGLCGVESVLLMSVASIVLGGALLIGGGTVAARFSDLFPGADQSYSEEIVGGGMALDSLAGIAGIVLGILALIGIAPRILMGAAAISFGGAMLLTSASMARLAQMPSGGEFNFHSWSSRNTLYAASGIDLLGGAGAIVLGILSLSGYSRVELVFVAFLAIGCANLLTSGAVLQKTSAFGRF